MASAYDIPGLYDYLTRFSGQDEVLAQRRPRHRASYPTR